MATQYSQATGHKKSSVASSVATISALIASYVATKLKLGPEEYTFILGATTFAITYLWTYAKNYYKNAMLKAGEDSEPKS